MIVDGYVLNSLIAKYAESTDVEVEDFLAASGGDSFIASIRGQVLEKRRAHQLLQAGRKLQCRDLQSHREFVMDLDPCTSKSPLWNNWEIQSLPNGVYSWVRCASFAAVDAV